MTAVRSSPCPLCLLPAKFFDWSSEVPWLSIEGCRCGGYFVQPALFDRPLSLDALVRDSLYSRVAALRADQREAWLVTADGRPDGLLEVRGERPGCA
jgi:hypothetical protein